MSSAVDHHYSINAAAAAQHAMGYRSSPRDSLRDSDRDEKRLSEISTNTTTSSGSTTTATSKRSKSHVGPWRLGRTLGKGSSGRVRLAKHSVTGQLAAVKIVPKAAVAAQMQQQQQSSTAQAHAYEMPSDNSAGAGGLPYGIEREVVIMKLIDHPNVMALYDVWENKGELYLVLEYIEGGELFDYLIRKGRLDEKEAIHYFRQIIYGIDYCHKFNICHRDLKPENLLLDKNRNIKIADFGMAALETKENMLETSCGSPHYASPEIVSGKHYHGAPSDIWSCGIILFALLTGHLPFDDDSIRKLLLKVQAGNFVMPKYLSLEAKDLIWRMLRVNPEHRITMPEILKHPLLTKYPVPSALKRQWEKYNNNQLTTFSSSLDSVRGIDMEIVKSLQILWHGASKEKIIRSLLLPDLNAEKTFYCLLLKYRHDHGSVDPISAPAGSGTSGSNAVQSSHGNTHVNHHNNNSHSKATANSSTSSHVTEHIGHSNTLVKKHINVRKGNHHTHNRSGSKSSVTSHKRNVSFVSVSKKSHTHSRQHSQTSQTSQLKGNSSRSPSSMSLEDSQQQDRAVHGAPRTNPQDYMDGKSPFAPAQINIASSTPVSNRAVSAPSTMGSYILPMIFEEDRFADAIEEEFDLKVLHRKPAKSTATAASNSSNKASVSKPNSDIAVSSSTKSSTSTATATTTTTVTGITSTTATGPTSTHKPARYARRPVASQAEDKDTIHVAKRPLPSKPVESVEPVDRAYSAGVPSSESFRARSHTGFNVYSSRNSSRTSLHAQIYEPRDQDQYQDKEYDQQEVTRKHVDLVVKGDKTKAAETARANTTRPDTSNGMSNNNIPTSRKPLGVRDPNAAFRVTTMLNGKEMSTNVRSSYYNQPNENDIVPPVPELVKKQRSSSRGAANFLRKLTLTPKRPPPPKPVAEQDVAGTKAWTMSSAGDVNSSSGNTGNSGSSSEIKQSWFMKLFNPQPQPSSATNNGGGQRRRSLSQRRKKKVLETPAITISQTAVKQVSVSGGAATRQMLFNMTPTRARHLLVEILEEWQKYGIQDIVENSATSSITAVISSDNVLGIRKASFKISVYAPRPTDKTTALFIQDSGSVNSFLRFADSLENMLRSMGSLANDY